MLIIKKKSKPKKLTLNSDAEHFVFEQKYFNKSVKRQAKKYNLTEIQTEKLKVNGFVKKKGFKISIGISENKTFEGKIKHASLTIKQGKLIERNAAEYFKLETDKSDFKKFSIDFLEDVKGEFYTGYNELQEIKKLRDFVVENTKFKKFVLVESGVKGKPHDNKQFYLNCALWHSEFETITFFMSLNLFILPSKKTVYYSLPRELIEISKDPDLATGQFEDTNGNVCMFDTKTERKKTTSKNK